MKVLVGLIKSLLAFVVLFVLLGCSNPVIGIYTLESKKMQGRIEFNQSSYWSLDVSQGLWNKHSDGKWIEKGNEIIIKSILRIDTINVLEEYDSSLIGVRFMTFDFEGLPYDSKLSIDNSEFLNTVGGELQLSISKFKEVKFISYDYIRKVTDTITVKHRMVDSNLITIKRLNTFRYLDYLFYDFNKLKKSGKRIYFPKDSIMPKLVFVKSSSSGAIKARTK